ncbi:MAG: reverse gyrase [Desulfurococcaceae archaeon]
MNSIMPIYKSLCPICNSDSLSIDIELNNKCSNCRDENTTINTFINFISSIEQDFSLFFEKATGFKPWGAQRHWIKRILKGENTVLIAPTGIGKTTLLLVYTLYSAMKGKRVIYVAPTRSLMLQAYKKIRDFTVKTSIDTIKVITYDSSKSKKRREEMLNCIKTCNYDVLIVTNHFLVKNYEYIKNCTPTLIIVDDVDSLLRSERSVHSLIKLLGYSDKAIELAKRRTSIIWKIIVGKVYGKDIEELVKEYIELDKQLENEISSNTTSQLIVASATGRSKGIAGRLLKDLLKIDLSGITIYGRDVTDTYLLISRFEESIGEIVELIEKLGKGCIIYLSPRHPAREYYEKILGELVEKLCRRGFKVGEATTRNISLFLKGELDVLIGYSTYYGSSVRGIDSPLHIKYVVFMGAPVFSVSLESFLSKINMLTRVLFELGSKKSDQTLRKIAIDIRKKTMSLSPSEKRVISLCLTGKLPESSIETMAKLSSLYNEIKQIYLNTLENLKYILRKEKVFNIGSITLVQSENRYLALIPDVMTYIQASGRTSRLVGNRMTHGLSIILEREELGNLVIGLEQRLKSFNRDVLFKPLNHLNLNEESLLLRKTRIEQEGEQLRYKSVLLVVESPTKAKTIARFFGKPTARRISDINIYTIPARVRGEVVEFNIVATRGHIFDLTTLENIGLYGVILDESLVYPVYSYIRKCKICGFQFIDKDTCPRCGSVVYSDSKQVVNVLRKLALEVDEIYISTDPDIEGEKIAYDVYIAIKPFNSSIWRAELHEITLQELLKAIVNRRDINKNLVEAEMYRRIFDRLVGFSLSQKLQGVYKLKYLGAGRVQTPVLGLIIDRYREHVKDRCKRVYLKTSEPLSSELSIYIDKSQRDIIELLDNHRKLEFVKVSEEVVEVQPRPPYTTDELLSDASRLGFTVDVAMKISQELFESGLITYHRTDSTYVSSAGIGIAREYLENKRLLEYFKPSHWGAQGTHEAIRPVYSLDSDQLIQAIDEGLIPIAIPLTYMHFKLYDIIFKRFITSQMKPFKAIKSKYLVMLENRVLSSIELYVDILEDGFNKVTPLKTWREIRDKSRFTVEVLEYKIMDSSKTPLYSDGDVVLLMKKIGIGRPSTYAKIISSLKRHGYVIESRNRRKLIPTSRGIMVYSYLKENYPHLISVETTRELETIIDKIAEGEIQGYYAVKDLLASLVACKLVDLSLISSLNFNSNIGLTFTLDTLSSN